MVYKEDFLKFIWDYVKKGARLKDVMETVECDKRTAIEIYDQASKLFGRGPRKENRKPNKYIPKKKVEPFKRVEGTYSNDGYLNILNKYN